MATSGFSVGDSLAGLIVDGVDETPYVAGTLSYEERRGIRLAIPFIHSYSPNQFDAVKKWFREGSVPLNLLLITDKGTFSLYGCRNAGSSIRGGSGLSTGYVAPSEVVYTGRDGDFEDALTVSEMRSQIDGLKEWTGFSAAKLTFVADDRNRANKVTVDVESGDSLTWRQGAATMTLSLHWETDQPEPGFRVREWVCLTTSFADPRPCSEHLAEQRKMIALLTLMFGNPVRFRRHEIRDSRFNSKVLTGKIVDVPFFEVVVEETASDFSRPLPEGRKLRQPLVTASEVKPESLERWAEQYSKWSRVIQPTVGTITRTESYVEDHVVNSSMSLEAAGHLIGKVTGEKETYSPWGKKTTATYVFRCLAAIGLDWSEAAESVVGLAKAVANNYNGIKHFDRGEFPPTEHTYLISRVAVLIVRLLAVGRLDPSLELVNRCGERGQFTELKREFKERNLYVNAEGKFGEYPAEETPSEGIQGDAEKGMEDVTEADPEEARNYEEPQPVPTA